MSKITIRPMEPEDWDAVSRIYLEGIATEHATFQTTCPPYAAWDASHTKDCRLVLLVNDVIAGWTALHRVDPRWCYRGVAEVSIYVGEQFRGHGLGCHLLAELCRQAEEAGYWTLQSTVLQDNAASRALHTKCGFRLVGRRERIARDCHGRWLDTFLMERRAGGLQKAVRYKKGLCTLTMQSPFLFRLFTSRQAYLSSPSTSTLPSTTAPAWERWNMLSTTAQYLSARQTIMASRQGGT